jgi:glutathione synthase/RimK-type ligase-like ATP-grasp enzyme
MARHIVVVESIKDWQADFPAVPVITVKDYLSSPKYRDVPDIRVINLCRSYRYLSTGYFCSLLAEPRRHKAIPSVKTLTNLSSKTIYRLNVEDLDEAIQKALKKRQFSSNQEFELEIFFGRCEESNLQDLARQIYDLFRCPLLRVEFSFSGKWHIDRVRPMHLNGWAHGERRQFFIDALKSYIVKPWRTPRERSAARFDLAILRNPREKMPPSNSGALQRFVRAGKRLGVDVELIEKKDYVRLAEYDGLFIRETTNIDHYTYRFAKKAQVEGMAVIDDPDSILKCTNKVYLAELLAANRIPAPKTRILHKGQRLGDVQFPIVLKIPDGSFSRGVVKANDAVELKACLTALFRESDLLLAQEFLYTEYDWRIGLLNGEPLFACQYFMSRKHWQVVNHGADGRAEEGGFKTWPVEAVPADVVATAVKLAKLIGDGLYGVDLKQNEQGVYVIEINDNPNIDAGVEDQFLGDRLYETVMAEFVRRMDS